MNKNPYSVNKSHPFKSGMNPNAKEFVPHRFAAPPPPPILSYLSVLGRRKEKVVIESLPDVPEPEPGSKHDSSWYIATSQSKPKPVLNQEIYFDSDSTSTNITRASFCGMEHGMD